MLSALGSRLSAAFSHAAAPARIGEDEFAVLLPRGAAGPADRVREALFSMVFGLDDDVRPEAVELYVHRLRKKLEGSGVAISTLRGLGYMLAARGGNASGA